MCLIILRKPDTENPPLAYLRRGYHWNAHGWGIAYNKDNVLHTFKSRGSLGLLLEKLQEVPPESTLLIHFRNASDGGFTEEYLHPFSINENTCFMHNGWIPFFNNKKITGPSDTMAFNDQVLKPLFDQFNLNIHDNTEIISRICRPMIFDSKLAFLDNEGHYLIINEKLGLWEKEVFYSNYKSLAKIPRAAALKLKFMELVNKKELTEIPRKDKSPDVAALLKE